MLTIPGNMGGVTGPCPSCQILIKAPLSMPEPTPAPVEPAYPTPPPSYPSLKRSPQPITSNPSILRPEPRQLPAAGPESAPNPARMRSNPSGVARSRAGGPGPPPQRHHRNRLMRLLVPITFLCIALGVIYGVKSFLQKDHNQNASSATSQLGKKHEEPAVKTILEPEDNKIAPLAENKETPNLPPEGPTMPANSDSTANPTAANPTTTTDPATAIPPVDGGIAALALLEKFLAMKTLEERMPHVETKRTEPELAASILSAPLPAVTKITVDIRESNAIEKLTDYYYHVDFEAGENAQNLQTMLVRTRGTSPPKVVVDPFLDLFGGRFARYAEKPSSDAGTFQVIISAGAFCYDDVPGADKKFTLKILSRDDSKEISKAYFGKRSKIGYMLEDESSGLAYGQAKACTIFMRWNTEEDPEKPFLEALDIKALNWNP